MESDLIDAPWSRRVPITGRRGVPQIGAVWRAFAGLISRHHAIFSFTVYLAIAAWWDRAAIAHVGSVCPCGLPGDPAQYTWAFVWFPHALFHGLSLLNTKAIWAPSGMNLAGATATPLLAFLLAPITWIWGPIVSYNVITILAPVTAASSAYLLCRYVSRSPWASLIAGLGFGFGTYEVGQLNGHLHLVVICCVPLAALVVLKGIDGAISRRRLCLQLAAILVAQFLISLEVFFTLTVLGAVSLALAWLLGGAGLRPRITRVLAPVAGAYLILGVLMSWYLVAELHAVAYAKGTGARLPTDGLSFFTPMVYTWIGGHAFLQTTVNYLAGPGETDAYIGIPMCLIVLGFIAMRWNRPLGRWLAAVLVLTVLWVLGPRLYVDGRPKIWLPYALISHLPGFDQVLQGRVAVYIALLCAVVLAMWLASETRYIWWRWARWALGLLAVAFVLPNIASPGASNAATWENPKFFSTSMYTHYLRRGETILPIRWGWLSESLMWQAETHMYFNLASGYFTTAILRSWVGPLTNDLWSDTPQLKDARRMRRLLTLKHISDVVVQEGEDQSWAPLLKAAGLNATASVGGVTVYHVPAVLPARHPVHRRLRASAAKHLRT